MYVCPNVSNSLFIRPFLCYVIHLLYVVYHQSFSKSCCGVRFGFRASDIAMLTKLSFILCHTILLLIKGKVFLAKYLLLHVLSLNYFEVFINNNLTKHDALYPMYCLFCSFLNISPTLSHA